MMSIKVLANTPQLVLVALSGELNYLTVESIEIELTSLLSGQGQDAVIDLSDVTLITSLAIGMFINISKKVKLRGSKFVLLKPQPIVAAAIQISRLTDNLGVTDDDSQY